MDAQQVMQEVKDLRVVGAMVRAERFGQATAPNGAIIYHTGYQSGATEFNAATARYTVRY